MGFLKGLAIMFCVFVFIQLCTCAITIAVDYITDLIGKEEE